MSKMEEILDTSTDDPPAEPGRSRGNLLIYTGIGISIAAVAVLASFWAHANDQANNARRAERTAKSELVRVKAQPPKVVTKTVTQTKIVPTFGRSVLMGVFASGAIQQGVYDNAGNESFTPNDSTCSTEYTQLSNQYTSYAIDRGQFMSACEASLPQTMKKDTAQ